MGSKVTIYKVIFWVLYMLCISSEIRAQVQLSFSGGVSLRQVLFPDRDGNNGLPEGSECVTTKGNDGICMLISSCPSLRGTFLFKLPVVCRWKDLEPVVCCPQDGASEGAKGPDPRWKQDKRKEQQNREGRQQQRLQSLHVPGCGRTLIAPEEVSSRSTSPANQRFFPLRPILDFVPGVRKEVPHFVVGGLVSAPNAWPWMAAIYIISPNARSEGRFLCGGALIDSRHVLTASHCFSSRRGTREPSSYLVRLGAHNVKDGKPFSVEKVMLHEEYKKGQYYHDIALLRLSRDARFSSEISPVCLPSEETSDEEIIGKNVTVTGWGDIAFGGVNSKVLREATIPVVSQEECNRNYSRVSQAQFPQGISNRQICAGLAEGGKDACQGDSGGPLVSEDPQTSLYHLVGIVSFGFRCATPGFPGVYTKVSSYLQWISEQTGGLRGS